MTGLQLRKGDKLAIKLTGVARPHSTYPVRSLSSYSSSLSSSIYLSLTAMPGPAVYAGAVAGVLAVVAVGVAFHEVSIMQQLPLHMSSYGFAPQYVYEPHIAPKFEEWAENFVERQRQKRRQRQGPILAQPAQEHGDENRIRRSTSPDDNRGGGSGTSIELEQLAARERNAWRHNPDAPGLRHRTPAGGLDEVRKLR